MATIHVGGATFILMPRVGVMGIQEQRIKGAYMNIKHRVGEETNSVGNHYTGENGWCSDEKKWVTAPTWQGGCPDAHRVQVLAQNLGTGTGALVCQSVIDGYGQYSARGHQGSNCED